MAGNDTAALVVAMSAQLTKFEKDLDSAYNLADKGARKIEARFAVMNVGGEAIADLGRKLGELATVAGIAELTRQMVELNKAVADIGDAAERVGLSTDQFQSLRYAIVATGGDVNTAATFMDRFSNAVAMAGKGQGDLYNFFRVNSVAIKDQNGQLLPAATLLAKYADLVKNTKSPQDQLNEAMMVGGRQAGPELVQVLRQGSEGLERFGVEAKAAGVVLDRDLIDQAKRTNEEFQKLKLSFQVGAESVAVGTFDLLSRSIKSVADGLGEVVDKLGLLEKFKGAPGISIGGGFNGGVGYVPGDGSIPRVGIDLPKPAPRRSEVASPLANGGIDNRFGLAPVDGTGTTKQYNEQAEAFRKLIQAQEERVRLLQAEQAGVGQTIGKQTELTTKVNLEAEARKALNLTKDQALSPAYQAQIDAEAKKIGEQAQRLDDLKRQWQGLNSAVQFAGDEAISAMDGLRNGTLSAKDAVNQLANSFIHAAEQALLLGSGPLAGIFGTQSNVPGGTGGILGLLVSGFRAGGGPVDAGSSYVVGEKGPEIFTPKSAGTIIPNGVAPAGGGRSPTVIIYSSPTFQAGMTPTDIAAIDAHIRQNNAELRQQVQQDFKTNTRLNPDWAAA